VLQRVRLLTEAEAVLVTLPVTIRDSLPSTSRVLPQLTALAEPGAHAHAELAPADRMKLDRRGSTLDDVLTLTKRIKELDTRTEICGIGGAIAMELLAEVGDRCGSPSKRSSRAGAAPHPSPCPLDKATALHAGTTLTSADNRAVNSVLHIVHVTRIRCHDPAKQYMTRAEENQKPNRAARRSHTRNSPTWS